MAMRLTILFAIWVQAMPVWSVLVLCGACVLGGVSLGGVQCPIDVDSLDVEFLLPTKSWGERTNALWVGGGAT